MFPVARSFRRALTASLVGAFVLTACGSSAPAADVAATVGGATITTDELARVASVFTAVSAIQQQPCGQTEGPTDTQQAACNRQALSAMILYRLAEAYAAGAGITVADADVQETFDGFEQSVGADVLAEQLRLNGVTEDDVRGLIRSSLLQDQVTKAVVAERVDEDALRQTYEESIAEFTTLHVDHILVDSEAQAQAIHDQVTAPGFTLRDFQALAKEVSTDPNAKQDGGELSVPAAQLVPEFAAAALALGPGEISEPVQTQYGWHVIWKIGEDVVPFEEAKDQLLEGSQQQAFGEWMREQTADGQVVVDPSFGRFDGERLMVVRIASTDPSATPSPSAVNAVPTP